MSTLVNLLAIVAGGLSLACAASAMPAMIRAFRAGVPIWYGGIGWYGGASRYMPEAARPHARRAMKRWLAAMGLLALAGLMAMMGGAIAEGAKILDAPTRAFALRVVDSLAMARDGKESG